MLDNAPASPAARRSVACAPPVSQGSRSLELVAAAVCVNSGKPESPAQCVRGFSGSSAQAHGSARTGLSVAKWILGEEAAAAREAAAKDAAAKQAAASRERKEEGLLPSSVPFLWEMKGCLLHSCCA